MKIIITYEQEDIRRLIQKDLSSQGLKHDPETFKWKGNARVQVEVEGSPSVEVEAYAEPSPVAKTAPPASPPTAPPQPPVVDVPPEDDGPLDMSAIQARSNAIARDKPGLYPTPTRQLMPGESFEWPGTPEPNR